MTTLISRSKITSKVAIIALALSVPFVGAANADVTQVSEQVSEKNKHHKGKKSLFSKKMAKRLSLSKEQIAQIDAIKAQAKIDGAPYKAAKKEFVEKKKDIMKQASFDQTALEMLQQEYQTIFAEGQLLRAKNQFAVMSVLTEEQKTKLEKMKKSHKGNKKGKSERKARKSHPVQEEV